MGYNTWYDVQQEMLNENVVKATVKALQVNGLAKLGYTYVNLDDGWAAGRFPNGSVYADAIKFPSGMKSLADYIHSNGMKFGVYTDRGTETCGGHPGSFGHETSDANSYASWGVDYVKEDSCHASSDHQVAFHEYGLMRDALNATGRPMFFSLCGWNAWYAPVGAALGNSWRIAQDDVNWAGILVNIDANANLSSYAGPGGWNDPCLLLGSTATGAPRVTQLQSRAQFNMWSIMASPLLLSLDVRSLGSFDLSTYNNTEVIAVNQDPLGHQGNRVAGGTLSGSAPTSTTNVWARPLADGSHALAFLNTRPGPADITCDAACFAAAGLVDRTQQLEVRDLWEHKVVGTTTPAAGYTASNLAAEGGSTMVRVYRPPPASA